MPGLLALGKQAAEACRKAADNLPKGDPLFNRITCNLSLLITGTLPNNAAREIQNALSILIRNPQQHNITEPNNEKKVSEDAFAAHGAVDMYIAYNWR